MGIVADPVRFIETTLINPETQELFVLSAAERQFRGNEIRMPSKLQGFLRLLGSSANWESGTGP
jgi:hypothetical protein